MKELKEQVNENTNRIIEKVKEMRQNFSKSIIKDSRSGSEKPVFQFYKRFVEIQVGSPNVLKLRFGTSISMLLGREHQFDGDFNDIS